MLHALGDALYSFLCALGYLLLAGGIGAWLLRRIRFPLTDRLEKALFSVGVGLWLLSYLPFLLSLCHILTPAGVKVSLALIVIPLALSYVRVLRNRRETTASREELQSIPRETKTPTWAYTVFGIGVIFLLSASSSCFTPMVDYDGLAYHIGAPKRWLELGRMEYLPTHLHTLWPMGAQMHYLLLFPFDAAESAKPLMSLYTLMTMGAVFALGRRLASAGVGWIAAGVVAVRAGVPCINTTSIEMPLTLFLTLSALALTGWRLTAPPGDRRRWFVLAGVMAGYACCIKLSGLLALPFLTGAVFLAGGDGGFQIKDRMRRCLVFSMLALICALPWYLRTWLYTGNPIYPFAYSLFGGSNWSSENSRVLSAYFRSFDLPGETMAERRAFVQRHLAKLAALLTAGLLLPGRRWTRGFLTAAGLFAMIQVSLSDNHRFLLPAAPFAAIVLGWWLMELERGVQAGSIPFISSLRRFPAYGYGFTALLAVLFLPNGLRQIRESMPVVLGYRSKADFINFYVNNREAFEWVNRTLPPDARFLYGPDNRTYYLQRAVYWSSEVFQRQIVYSSPAEFHASLRREKIGYLILNRDVYRESAIHFETRMGWRENERRRLAEAAAAWEKLYEKNGVEVYRVPATLLSSVVP